MDMGWFSDPATVDPGYLDHTNPATLGYLDLLGLEHCREPEL